MKIGLVGLGNMGGRIAKRLIKRGHELQVYDVNPEALKRVERSGAKAVDTLQELAEGNTYVITILPNANIVEQVVLGETGLITGLKRDSVVIDMTSSIPEVTERIGKTLAKHGIRMLDAPVSGGVKRAEDGTLAVMVGGEEGTFREVHPILQDIGTTITHVGKLGSGHAIKALNNLVSATTLSITLEALAVGMKAGLDPHKMLEVINHSTGKNNSSENKVAQQILSGKYEVGFTLDLMNKDLKTAMAIAEQAEVPVAVASSVFKLWEDAASKGNGEKIDHTEIAKLIEEKAGLQFSS